MFVLSVCVGRGSLTPEPQPGGGRSLLRPQPLKLVAAFQAWNLGVVGPGEGWGSL